MDDEMSVLVILMGIVFCLIIFFIPTIIAFLRGHHYKWIIFAVNIFGSAIFGMGWLIALVWSLWPKETSVLDPIINDPTSNSRNANKQIYSRYGENLASFNESAKSQKSFCPNCGVEITQGNFCQNCGTKIETK